MGNIKLISFFGLNDERIKKKFLFIVKKNFEETFVWTPKYLKKNYKDFRDLVKDFSNPNIKKFKEKKINYNRNWTKIGFYRWKPFIILFSLKKLRKNKILIFHDINFEKYPNYLDNFKLNKNFFLKMIDNKSVVIFRDTYQPIVSQCKGFLIDKYLPKNFNLNLNGFWGGLIIVRNNKVGRRFIYQWCKLSTFQNLSPLPDVEKTKINKKFIINTADQATLTINFYKNFIKEDQIKIIYAPFRRVLKIQSLNIKNIYQYIRGIKEYLKIKFLEIIN